MIGRSDHCRTSAITSLPSRSGRPRSRIMVSTVSRRSTFRDSLAFAAVNTLCPAADSDNRNVFTICGSSSTIKTLLCGMSGLVDPLEADMDGGAAIVPDRADCSDGAAHRLDQPSRDREAETGALGGGTIGRHAVELVEHALQVFGRDA